MKQLKKGILVALLLLATIGYSQNNESNEKVLHHVLLFQWSVDHDKNTKAEVLSLFEGLPSKIKGLKSFEILDVTSSSGNFDSVLIFQFSSEEALEIYQEHPDHLRVKEIAPPLLSGFSEYDYWKER